MALNLRHLTGAQLAAIFRERYRTAEGVEAARLATWLLNRIDAGDFTDAQVRNTFGLSVLEWTTLKTRMDAQRSRYLAIRADRGE